MGLNRLGVIEQTLLGLLIPLCIATGAFVALGFFFPEIVGDAISGELWLVVSLSFFVSVLLYLALLPTKRERDADQDETPFLHIRRTGVTETIVAMFARMHPLTFGVPVVLFAGYFLAEYFVPETTITTVSWLQEAVTTNGGWFFVGVTFVAVCFCFFLVLGPWGDVRLGGPDIEPTYTLPVYFTMFFTAGIAAGIVFWGPAEALFHYQQPPPYFGVESGSEAAISAALVTVLFHWGFSAWSAYIVIGVPIAYFVYQHGTPLRVSALLTPFLGVDGLDSRWSTLVDLLAIFATVGGIATSIALVSQQFLTGINFQWGVEFNQLGSMVFVAGLTLIFVASAQSGVHRGIRRLSVLTMVLFALFVVFFVAIAPRGVVINDGATALGGYAINFVPMSLHVGGEWEAAWTIWNWAWWFSWAPFAGLFLAALSRGRRIRTVVLVGFVATSLASMVWFLLVSVTATHYQHGGIVDILAAMSAAADAEAVAAFPLFEALPLSDLLMFLFLALIIAFMSTSADTSTLVVAVLATRREVSPTTGTIIFWGAFQGVVALAVLATGSAETLQAMAVLVGGPFALVSFVSMVGVSYWFLRNERGHSSLFGRAKQVASRMRERR